MISLISLSVVVFGLVGALVVTHLARTSPLGHEDTTGFHFADPKEAKAFARAQQEKENDFNGHTQHPFPLRG
jgi:hypothetical protein